MLDGTTLEGEATMPNNPSATPIKFKDKDGSKTRSISCAEIRTLVYVLRDDKTIEFDRMDVYEVGKPNKTRPLWLSVLKRGAVTLASYEELDVLSSGSGNLYKFHTIWTCYRAGEKAATVIASTERKNKKDAFIVAATEYFKDDAELTKKIRNGQYEWGDMPKIVEEYNERKNN